MNHDELLRAVSLGSNGVDLPDMTKEPWDPVPDEQLQLAWASHPQCPEKLQRRLARQKNHRVHLALAENMSTTAGALTDLLNYSTEQVRLMVLHHRNLSTSKLHGYCDDTSPAVRAVVAARSQRPEVLERLACDRDASVRLAASQNHKLPNEVRILLQHLGFDQSLQAIAPSGAWLESSMLIRVYHERPWIRWVLLKQPELPSDVIALFANDDSPAVRALLATSQLVSRSTLLHLLGDQVSWVRSNALANPAFQAVAPIVFGLGVWKDLRDTSTPEPDPDLSLAPYHFTELMNAGPWLLERVARHPNIPIPYLEQLSAHNLSRVRWGVAQNTTCPALLLNVLAQDQWSWVRRAVAEHIRTPLDTVRTLTQDADEEVRETALQRMALQGEQQDRQISEAELPYELDEIVSLPARIVPYVIPDAWINAFRHRFDELEDLHLVVLPEAGLPPLHPGQLLVLASSENGQPQIAFGGGEVIHEYSLTLEQAWHTFMLVNLTETYEQWIQQIQDAFLHPVSAEVAIRSVLLTNIFLLDEEQAVSLNSLNFATLQRSSDHVGISDIGAEGSLRGLLENIGLAPCHDNPAVDHTRFGKAYLVHPRLGQNMFRASTLQLYNGTCCLSGARVTTVLDAAHIKPYAADGEHKPENSLLLRSDIHKLFDSGEISIHPETLKVQLAEVSAASHDPNYTFLHGQVFHPPDQLDVTILRDNLRHHYNNVFRYTKTKVENKCASEEF